MQGRYGATPAALVLERIVDKESSSKNDLRRVNSIIQDLHVGLNFIHTTEDLVLYENLWRAWVAHIKDRVHTAQSYISENLRTHLLTTITGISRQKRREFLIPRGASKFGKRRWKKINDEYKKHRDNYKEFLDEVGP